MDYDHLCSKAIEVIRSTGEFIQKEAGSIGERDIKDKGLNSFVTYVDEQAEKSLVKGLGALLPGAGFLTEESTEDVDTGGYRWIIDPIDGTTNYIYGIPCYSVSVALMNKEKAVIGIVYEISHDECFYATADAPAMLNGQEISVNPTSVLSECLIATGFPYDHFEYADAYLSIFKHFIKNTRGIRRLGSAAVDLAYVACGRFDAFYEHRLNPWDVAAGAFIVEKAGGKVTDFGGGTDFLFGGEIIGSNGGIHDKMIEIVSRNFEDEL